MVDIHFSLSDRIRYYWPHPRIRQSVEKLSANLTETKLPLGLISQYMPVQFERLSLNELSEKVDLTLSNLSILKTGKAKAIRFSTLEAICRALDCQPGDILEYIED